MDADREFDPNTVVYCFSRQNNRHPLLHQRKLISWSTTKVGKLVLPSRNISLLFSLLSITFISLSLSLSLSLSSKTKSIANLSQYHSFPPPLTICMFVFLSTDSSVRRSLTYDLSIYLSIYLSIRPKSMHPSDHSSVLSSSSPSVRSSTYMSFSPYPPYLSLNLFLYLPINPSARRSLPPKLILSIYLSIYLSQMDGWLDDWMDGWMDGGTDGQTHVRTDRHGGRSDRLID